MRPKRIYSAVHHALNEHRLTDMLITLWDTPIWKEAFCPPLLKKGKTEFNKMPFIRNQIQNAYAQTRKPLPSNNPFPNNILMLQHTPSFTGPIFPSSFWQILSAECNWRFAALLTLCPHPTERVIPEICYIWNTFKKNFFQQVHCFFFCLM